MGNFSEGAKCIRFSNRIINAEDAVKFICFYAIGEIKKVW